MSLETQVAALNEKVTRLEQEAEENDALLIELKAEIQKLKDEIANGNDGAALQPALDRLDAVIAKFDKNTPAESPEA